MHKLLLLLFVFVLALVPACQKQSETSEQASATYPETIKSDQVDDFFGTEVPDPYRWLEDDRAEEVEQWVEAQNNVTFAYLENIPFRNSVLVRVRDLYNYPKQSAPWKVGDNYFYTRNEGLQNQSVIYIQKGLEGEPEVFIDPNALSPDGTIRISLASYSQDYRYIGVMRSEAGSDWQEIRVYEIETRNELPDRIQWVKFTGLAWCGDGFYYSGYEKPEEGQELTAANQFQKIYFHKLGDPQEEDVLVYEDPEHPYRYMNVGVTEDKQFLILNISEGTSGNELYFRAAGDELDAPFKSLIPGFDYDSYVIDSIEGGFLVYTNNDAPKYKVVLIDPLNPQKENWSSVIAEAEETLEGAGTAGKKLFCSYLKDASTRVYQYDLKGKLEREIQFPALGSAYGFSGKPDDTFIFYSFSSFTFPPTIYKYTIATGESEVYYRTEVPFDPEEYVTNQVFYTSKDGTRVPMFVVHKKGLSLDGKRPTLLTAYGGFNISLTPYFNPTITVILENDGVFAQPNLRGGGEYGEEWHQAGMLENKQNVFDDFISAAEYLIAENYTSSERLAISGASNGGLLVGACMTQRPDLFKVALPAVGVMDMLRFHKFTVGWGWVVEYGSSDKQDQFEYLYKYSPLHNIKAGVPYPATLVTTADHDDRVVPAHSFKFIASLQEKHEGENPVLIRIETKSGHGSSNVSKMIEELADEFSFLFYNMGIQPKGSDQ